METELWKQSYRLAKQPFCFFEKVKEEIWCCRVGIGKKKEIRTKKNEQRTI